MFFKHQFRTRISALLAAVCMALAVNGSLLLGFDSMATQAQDSQPAVAAMTPVAFQPEDSNAVL